MTAKNSNHIIMKHVPFPMEVKQGKHLFLYENMTVLIVSKFRVLNTHQRLL